MVFAIGEKQNTMTLVSSVTRCTLRSYDTMPASRRARSRDRLLQIIIRVFGAREHVYKVYCA